MPLLLRFTLFEHFPPVFCMRLLVFSNWNRDGPKSIIHVLPQLQQQQIDEIEHTKKSLVNMMLTTYRFRI